MKLGKYNVPITNEDTVWFPRDKITKGDILDYYTAIASIMIPHMRNRVLTMQRFTDRVTKEGFYHKEAPAHFPKWIKRVRVKKKTGGVVHHVVCNNAATLVYLANQRCLTPHLWLSRIDKLHSPDRLIFDLDPSGVSFGKVCTFAQELGGLLEEIGLEPFVMLTGSRGVHVVCPIKRTVDFDYAREVAQDIAQMLVAEFPKALTLEVRKAKRRGKIYLDTLRNAYAQTGVAPYAVRARPGAPVAVPLEWDELSDKKLTAQKFTIKNIFRRLDRIGDPWKDINRHARSLKKAHQKLRRMV